jgi:uncharacterized SAM-dependent methyltransferase
LVRIQRSRKYQYRTRIKKNTANAINIRENRTYSTNFKVKKNKYIFSWHQITNQSQMHLVSLRGCKLKWRQSVIVRQKMGQKIRLDFESLQAHIMTELKCRHLYFFKGIVMRF